MCEISLDVRDKVNVARRKLRNVVNRDSSGDAPRKYSAIERSCR